MAKEILKDELLSEEQLDNVAGGTIVEIASDSQFLRDSGAASDLQGWGNYATEQRFDEISGYVTEAWKSVGIICTPSKDGANTYAKADGTAITRAEAFQMVAAANPEFKFKPRSYGFPSNDWKKC